GRQAPAGRAGGGLRRARELLGRSRRRPRVPALHPARGVPRLARSRRAALGRPCAHRGLAARAGAMSDDFEQKGPDWDKKDDAPQEDPFAWPTRAWEGGSTPEETPHEPYSYEALQRRLPAHRPRDPLARLFPGLPRGARVALDWS